MQICSKCKEIYDVGALPSETYCPRSTCDGRIVDLPICVIKSAYELIEKGYTVNTAFDMSSYSKKLMMVFSINTISEDMKYPDINEGLILTKDCFDRNSPSNFKKIGFFNAMEKSFFTDIEKKNFQLIEPCFDILKEKFLIPIFYNKDIDCNVYFWSFSITFNISFKNFKDIANLDLKRTQSDIQIFQDFLNYRDKCIAQLEKYANGLPQINNIVETKEE